MVVDPPPLALIYVQRSNKVTCLEDPLFEACVTTFFSKIGLLNQAVYLVRYMLFNVQCIPMD